MSIATGALADPLISALQGQTAAAANAAKLQAIPNIFGGIAGAVSAYAQGKYEKRIAGINARMLDFKAEDAIRRGEVEARRSESATRGVIGSQRAAAAAQGVDVDSGSAADAQESAAGMGAIDALTIRNNAYREAWGYRVEALDQRNQGSMSMRAGRFQAGQTLLGSMIDASTSYRRGQNIQLEGDLKAEQWKRLLGKYRG